MQMTPNDHEKSEWSRMAQDAYSRGNNRVGHKLSAVAALPHGAGMPLHHFDQVQEAYRAWLISGTLPA